MKGDNMQDRVSLYPGRVKLEPVAGQANLYDLTRADQPTQEGTPLNKASLLKDATAELFGLGPDALPDDALAVIAPLTKKNIKNFRYGEILTSANWKAPANIVDNKIYGFLVGGGGGGGSGTNNSGGGSGYIVPFAVTVVPENVYPMVIGAGGAGGFDFSGMDMGDIFGDIFGDFFGGGSRRGPSTLSQRT